MDESKQLISWPNYCLLMLCLYAALLFLWLRPSF